MKITLDMKVRDIKNDFSAKFPMLKIEFYAKKHGHFKGSKDKEIIDDSMLIKKLNPKIIPGVININDQMIVDQFETIMEEKFGLHVQVFRKSGEQWLQTSITDNWTLKKQEEKAEETDFFMRS